MIFSNLVCKTPDIFIYYICTCARHMHRQHNLHSFVHRSRIIRPGVHWSRIKSSSTLDATSG